MKKTELVKKNMIDQGLEQGRQIQWKKLQTFQNQMAFGKGDITVGAIYAN
jgi:hypothetical protein